MRIRQVETVVETTQAGRGVSYSGGIVVPVVVGSSPIIHPVKNELGDSELLFSPLVDVGYRIFFGAARAE